jgi:dTDP-4-dehydrorhamnose 3,5-epimerase
MRITPTELAGVVLIAPVRHEDARGFFVETYNWQSWSAAGITTRFVQDNHSLSRPRGTIRGLHFQTHPFAQDKLVRVVRGSILDVAVDIRRGSSSFGRHVAVTLTADDPTQILVPVGFAHGFCTLEPDTEVVYKVSNVYSQPNDRSLRWNDPALGIRWPVGAAEAIVSDKDAAAPLLADLEPAFSLA